MNILFWSWTMNVRRWICALVCAALVAGPAFAQGEKGGGGRRGGGGGGGQPPRGGMMGGGGGLLFLAMAKDVQTDLKLTDDQTKKLDELNKSTNDKRQKMRQEMQDSGADRNAMMEKMQELNKETDKGLAAIVSPDQMKRLKQVSLQQQQKTGGLMAVLNNPDVKDKLGLNDEQKEQLSGFQEDARRSRTEIFQENQGDREAIQQKMAEYNTSMNKKLDKLLTADQKAKLKDLEGEPFKGEIPRPQFGGKKAPPV
jgi:hypothetical protein